MKAEKRFKFTCLECGKKFEATVELDELGWHTAWPHFGTSFDVDYDEEKDEVIYDEADYN